MTTVEHLSHKIFVSFVVVNRTRPPVDIENYYFYLYDFFLYGSFYLIRSSESDKIHVQLQNTSILSNRDCGGGK